MYKISIKDDDIDSILITLGDKIKHYVGTIDEICFQNSISDENISISRLVFMDKVYDNFNIEINQKSGKFTLENFSIIERSQTTYGDGVCILENVLVLRNIAKTVKEEDHTGQIYNPYNDTWSWL